MKETKRVDLSEKIRQAKQTVSLYTSAIENMKAQRDTTLCDIERFQLALDVCLSVCCVVAFSDTVISEV